MRPVFFLALTDRLLQVLEISFQIQDLEIQSGQPFFQGRVLRIEIASERQKPRLVILKFGLHHLLIFALPHVLFSKFDDEFQILIFVGKFEDFAPLAVSVRSGALPFSSGSFDEIER